MTSISASSRQSPVTVIIGAALAYVVAMVARGFLVPDSVVATHLARSLDVSLLYAITLLPGIVVGTLCGRRVLEFGFAAGALGEVLRAGSQMALAVMTTPETFQMDVPWLSTLLGSLIQALPSGVLGAAGGAVGYVFRVRATAPRTQQK